MTHVVRWLAVPMFAVLLVGQPAERTPPSLSDLPRLKNFTAHQTSSTNRFQASNDDSKRVMPGETHVMADLKGPGIVNHIWLTIADNEFAWPRLVRFRVYYDGKKTPSIDVPLGDFFGVGHGYDRNLDSAMVRNSSYGRAKNSYWPMPFRQSCRITITDEGDRPVTMFYYHVDWQKYDSLPADTAYLHAYYRQERPAAAKKHYEFLDVKGTGHYAGTVLNVIQAKVGWFGEGDDLFYVDGSKNPQIVGTGTEDYVNEAWGLRVSSGPWYGTPVAEGELVGARLTGYRWHVPDPIPFTKSLWAGIEHAGWTYNDDGSHRSGFEERPDYFSSTAFWYQKGVNEDLPEPPYGKERLPLGNALQIAVEDSLQDVTVEKGKATVQREVDWGRDLLFFEAEGGGARINVPIDVPASGRYELLARIAQAPDYGDYIALLDGKPANVDNRQAATSEIPMSGAPVIHNYQPEVYVAADVPLGWLELSAGRHILSFICVGRDARSSGYHLGINNVVLERIPSRAVSAVGKLPNEPKKSASGAPVFRGRSLQTYVNALEKATGPERAEMVRALGSFSTDAAPARSVLARSLADSDPNVRQAAAWAFSQMGLLAAGSFRELERSLADADPRVRSTTAVAMRAIGPKVVESLPALSKALDDPEFYVRAVVADAIGNCGPAAKSTVAQLAAQLGRPGESVFVLRSISTALGKIGPDAASAIPALEQVSKMYRVTYAAQEAILRIQGQPAPTWW